MSGRGLFGFAFMNFAVKAVSSSLNESGPGRNEMKSRELLWQSTSTERSFWKTGRDGQEYYGYGFGASGDKVLEIVFNTSMVGYQEILSDPSYTDQAVVMTYPLIGNYGMAEEDYESAHPSIGALIVREYNDEPSNFRSAATLEEVMKKYGIVGVWGVDTRKLNRSIRDFGSRRALITDAATSREKGLNVLPPHRCRFPGKPENPGGIPGRAGAFPCSRHRLRHETEHRPFSE